jgi:hypothetical protein
MSTVCNMFETPPRGVRRAAHVAMMSFSHSASHCSEFTPSASASALASIAVSECSNVRVFAIVHSICHCFIASCIMFVQKKLVLLRERDEFRCNLSCMLTEDEYAALQTWILSLHDTQRCTTPDTFSFLPAIRIGQLRVVHVPSQLELLLPSS